MTIRLLLFLCGLLLAAPPAFALIGTANEIDVDQGGRIGIVDPLIVSKGGTGVASWSANNSVILTGTTGTGAVQVVAGGSAGATLVSGGAGVAPTFTTLDLANAAAVTGTLPVARGGTNLTAAAEDNVMVGNGTTWQSKVLTDCATAVTYNGTTNTFGCNAVVGTAPIIMASTLGDVTGGQTTYFAPGTVDATEGRAAQVAPEAFSLDDLKCVSSVVPGTANTYIITMGDGACGGALTDSVTQTVTITNASVVSGADGGAAEAVSSGACWRWKVVSLDADTASAVISCSARRTA